MRRTGSDLSVSLYVSRNRYSIRFGRTDRIFPSLYTTIICIIISTPVINKRVILVLMCKNNYCDASQPQNAILLSPAVSYRIVSLSLSLSLRVVSDLLVVTISYRVLRVFVWLIVVLCQCFHRNIIGSSVRETCLPCCRCNNTINHRH